MGAYNIVNATSMQAGQPEDVSQVLANFQAIAAVLNGGIDSSNITDGSIVNADISASAAIAQAKLAPIQIARIAASGTNVTSADGEKQLVINNEADAAGIGTIVSNNYRIDIAGTYMILPSMYTFNLGGGSNQQIYVRLNPAGVNTWLTSVNLNAGVSAAGGDRWVGGVHVVVTLAANDIIRLNGTNSEAVARQIDAHLILIKVA